MKEVLFENHEMILELEKGLMITTFKLHFLDLETTKKLVEHRKTACKGNVYPLLANILAVKNATKEARDYFASEKGCEGITAAGIIIGSELGSMIGNFYSRISKPLRPTRLFTDEEEAKKWLVKYLQGD